MLPHRVARRLPWAVTALLALAAPAAPAARADGPRAPGAGRPVARSVGPAASLLRREAPDRPWQVVREGEELRAGDLVVGTAPGALVSADGAVRLSFLGDPSGTG